MQKVEKKTLSNKMASRKEFKFIVPAKSPPSPELEPTLAPKHLPKKVLRQLKERRNLSHVLCLTPSDSPGVCEGETTETKELALFTKPPKRGFEAASGHASSSCRARVTTVQCQADACVFGAQSYTGYLPLISETDRQDDVNSIAIFEWHIS